MTEGIINRFRTMAIARVSVLTGHVLGSVIQTTVGAVLVTGLALALGFRPAASPAGWLGAIALVVVLAFACTWASVALGLLASNPEGASNNPLVLALLPFLGSADLFDLIRGLGISPQAMRIERDGWILLAARYPRQARIWAQIKLAALADREFQQVYRAYYQTYDWDPADPRLDEVADAIVNFADHHRAEMERHQVDLEQVSAGAQVDDPVAMALVLSRTATMPPAWKRLDQLCREKAHAKGVQG